MIYFFKAIRTLFSYIVLAICLGGPTLILLPFIGVSKWALNGWYANDVAICAWAHGTEHRSISGWAGQHKQTKKRYLYIANVIDLLFKFFRNEQNHCYNAYINEQNKGFVQPQTQTK